jgi:hypothetical protein
VAIILIKYFEILHHFSRISKYSEKVAKKRAEMGEKRAKTSKNEQKKRAKKARFCSAFFSENYSIFCSFSKKSLQKKAPKKRHLKKGT